MRDILKNIEGTDKLAQLFNAYLKGLSTPSIMCDPCYTTMAEVRGLRDGTLKKKHARMLKHSVKNFHNLTVLSNSLHHIHDHVLKAIAELEGFFDTYIDNLLDYAADKRVKSLMENGSNSDEEALTDWYRDNEADETEAWKAVRKTDPESLKHYSLYQEMGWHFGIGDAGRGEYIGTSGPEDFEPYTRLVVNQSAFSFRKMLEGVSGREVQISRMQADGSMVPMTLGDHVEAELNEDLAGERVSFLFNIAVGFCVVIRERYQAMSPDDLLAYRSMYRMLLMVRDMQFPPETFDMLLAQQPE